MNRRAIVAALAALPFGLRAAAAATIPDIHELQPYVLSTDERRGSLRQAVAFFPNGTIGDVTGKTFGVYGTPLVVTEQSTSIVDPAYTMVLLSEINL